MPHHQEKIMKSKSSSRSRNHTSGRSSKDKRRRKKYTDKQNKIRERDEHKRTHKRTKRDEDADDSEEDYSSSSLSSSESASSGMDDSSPREIMRSILREFPTVSGELHQLLQMIDSGEGVDISGISDKMLARVLKKLFKSLNLRQTEKGAYLLPRKCRPSLDVVGSLFPAISLTKEKGRVSTVATDAEKSSSDYDSTGACQIKAEVGSAEYNGGKESPLLIKRRVLGPEMPSQELLAAAAELTEAIRDAENDQDDDLLIGPPPPSVVAEAASANEAERLEEVARIAGADANSPYDVLGANWKMSSENIKKRYWKLSLLVHPDKCAHPLAHEAFVMLNKAFKELQDPGKKDALDQKLRDKEEQEKFQVELKSMREAAEWRRSQGISIDGDEELLAMTKEAPLVKEPPKREEWMTTLPPERKPGVSMQSTTFSRSGKEGRGDTSGWTESPLDRVQKATQNYLDAYDKTKMVADAEDQRRASAEAVLVDQYNSSKRSMSLVQKHQDEHKKEKKNKKQKQSQKEEWAGNHPWKPWDREKDLAAGRKSVNLDPKSMSQGLSSRFSSGAMQRNFL